MAGLRECPGYFLSKDIRSGDNIPCYDNSAMDGYAVRCDDLSSANARTPVALKIIDEVPAGKVSEMA